MRKAEKSRGDLKERLEKSERNRKAVVDKFGFVPMSILKLSRGRLSRRMFNMQHETPSRNSDTQTLFREKKKKLEAVGSKSVGIPSGRITGHGTLGLSIMPAELVEFFIKYYARAGQTFIDPFAGHGIRMQVAKIMGMHYLGYDLCEEFIKFIRSVIKKVDDGKTTIQLTHGDSREPRNIPDDSGDFCMTSPPYWNVENYGDDPRQLGYRPYEEFLDGMEEVGRTWLPKFKKGGICVLNTGDMRIDKKFYPYTSDLTTRWQRAGWTVQDWWIVDGLVAGTSRAFAVDFTMQGFAARLHESCVVFMKK